MGILSDKLQIQMQYFAIRTNFSISMSLNITTILMNIQY